MLGKAGRIINQINEWREHLRLVTNPKSLTTTAISILMNLT
jgi:hypothetical protein